MTRYWTWIALPLGTVPHDDLPDPLPAPTWYAARAEVMRATGASPDDVVIREVEAPVNDPESPDGSTIQAPPPVTSTILPPPMPPEAESGVRVRDFETVDLRGPPLPRVDPPSGVELAAHAVVDLGAWAVRRLLNGSGGRR